MLRNWFLLSLRRFRRSAMNSLINVLGLTLGLFVFMVIFIYVDHEFRYDTFHANGNRIYRLVRDNPTNLYLGSSRFAVLPAPLYDVLKGEIAGVEEVARMSKWGALVVEAGDKTFYDDNHFAADPGIFKMLTFESVAGNLANALRPHSAAISEKTAMKFFGTTDVVGKAMRLTSFVALGEYTIDVVFKDFPSNSSLNFNILLPFVDVINATQPSDLTSWSNSNYNYLVMLQPGADPRNLEHQLDDHLHKKYAGTREEESAKATFYIAQALPDLYLGTPANFDFGPKNDPNRLYMLGTIALFVLAVAAINYINLTTARAISRAKEVAVRKVSGAQQHNLVLQFLGDSLLLTLVAAAIAMMAAWSFFPAFRDFIGKPLDVNIFSPRYFISALALSFIVGSVAGLYPAFTLSAFQPARVLKGTFARSAEGTMLRNILSVLQFTISGALIIAVAVIAQQLSFIENRDPGYQRDHILSVSLSDEGVRKKGEYFLQELSRNPNIAAVSLSTAMPNSVRTKQDRRWVCARGEYEVSFYSIYADEHYLDLFDIKIVEGRNFLPTDRNAFLINETAAKTYGWKHPVGMEFTGERAAGQPGDTVKIIGVIKDMHFDSYRTPIQPLRIGFPAKWTSVAAVKIKPADMGNTVAFVEKTYKNLATSKLPYHMQFFDEQFSAAYKSDQQLGKLINIFSVVAVVIACLGLYGLSTHSLMQRLKEISIRKILGAEVGQIAYLVVSKFLLLITVAFVLACPLAWYLMERWLEGFAYHIDVGVLPFVIAISVLMSVAFATIAFQTLKVARSNPSNTLRAE